MALVKQNILKECCTRVLSCDLFMYLPHCICLFIPLLVWKAKNYYFFVI